MIIPYFPQWGFSPPDFFDFLLFFFSFLSLLPCRFRCLSFFRFRRLWSDDEDDELETDRDRERPRFRMFLSLSPSCDRSLAFSRRLSVRGDLERERDLRER